MPGTRSAYETALTEGAASSRATVSVRVPASVGPESEARGALGHIKMLYIVGGWGGAERVDLTELFAKQLASQGLNIDWVIFQDQEGPAWRREAWRGADARVVRRGGGSGLVGAVTNKLIEMMADLRAAWLALAGGYDLIQVRDKFVVAVLALAAARLRGAKFTYWLSYPFAECRILDADEGRARVPFLSRLGGRVAAWLLYRVIMPNADHVFVQSRQMLRDVAAEGVAEDRMTPVPMAVSAALLEQPALPVEPETILYLGTLTRIRKLDVLLQALAIVHRTFPSARLVFVGDGDMPEDRVHLERLAKELGLEQHVEMTGMIPMSQAHERVRRAAVCVSPFYPTPILMSTSPTKLIEYMALGRPVVANEHPEQSLVLGESQAGFCVPWGAEDFARGICALLSDPDEAEIKGRRGRDYVRDHRIYEIVAADVSREYRRILPRAGFEE